jgi:oligoribonuclease (3'-5' exoribonuclease)
MKYLSLDIEATGLAEHDLIIEFAVVPFDTDSKSIAESLAYHHYIHCPTFESLEAKLDPWVRDHNKELIIKANKDGISLEKFRRSFEDYLKSKAVRDFFAQDKEDAKKIILFGKSMNAIDLPFLNRDLGWNFMRDNFHHQVLDLSSVTRGLIDLKKLPAETKSGSGLMKYLGLGDVAHTAFADAVNTAKLYLKILEMIR